MSDEIERLRFEIRNVQPVAVEDYAASLDALADEYKRYLTAFEPDAPPGATKLFVKEIRKGSIINDLQPILVGALPLLEVAKTMIAYGDYLKAIIDWTLGKTAEQPPLADDKKTLNNVVNIVEPTARDRGAQMNIGVLTVSGAVTINVGLDSIQANATQNFVKRFQSAAPESRDRTEVVLHWFQTRNALNNRSGDQAKIESISPDPVKVRFASEELKTQMVLNEANPFKKAYVVDVSVETVDDKPVLYRITQLHDTIDLAS